MRLVYSLKYDELKKSFKEIGNSIEDVLENNPYIERGPGLEVAMDLASTIREKYNAYLTSISDFVHETDNTRIYITNPKGKYVVHVSGREVLYHEYGTGTRGLRKPHPRHDKDGMNPYGSGKTDKEHKYSRIVDPADPPYWYLVYRDFPGAYPNDFNDAPIRATDYVWRHKGVITKGIPAGRFIYDSCREYQKGYGLDEKQVLKRTIIQTVAKDLAKELKKSIK